MSSPIRFRLRFGHALTFLALVLALCAGLAQAKAPGTFDYHGWRVDISRALRVQPAEKSIAAIDHQLDIVEQVHLPPEMLAFMRSVPIWVDPTRREGGPGHYERASGIDLHVRELDPDKPIVLHELLHAFHDQRLGTGNAAILRFWSRAKQIDRWPADAYFLSNHKEFFAVTASVYLFGDIPRPPYSRALLLQTQPLYYQWLADLFDDGKPRPTAAAQE